MFPRMSLTVVSCILVLLGASEGFGQQKSKVRKMQERESARNSAGVIDGAVWSFRLMPTAARSNRLDDRTITGRYRISDLKIFQAESPEGEMSKEVGSSKPNTKDSTIVEFESISGMNARKEWTKQKGKALLRRVKGERGDVLEGEFIDSEGLKWKLVVRRIQE